MNEVDPSPREKAFMAIGVLAGFGGLMKEARELLEEILQEGVECQVEFQELFDLISERQDKASNCMERIEKKLRLRI
jgi:hypothetical protein